MLSNAIRARGMTIIELMVGLTILAFLLMSGAPAVSEWIRNAQIRSASESILSGLHHARAEAVKRNTPVRFQLTSTLESDCALSTSGKSWVINLTATTSPAGACNNAMSDTATPYMLQKSVASASTSPVTVAADQPDIAFNGLGQQMATDTHAATNVVINIKASSGTCLADQPAGTLRCLRIIVSPAGQARLCDPNITDSAQTRATACPA